MIHGRRVEAVAEMSRVRELDPLSMSASQARVNVLSIFRQNAEAIELQKKIVELNKSHPGPHERLGLLYVRVGQYREAIAEYQETIKLGKDNAGTQILLATAYAHMGERDKAREILERYESEKDFSPVTLAWVYVALGERDKTFAALEKAYAAHDQTLIYGCAVSGSLTFFMTTRASRISRGAWGSCSKTKRKRSATQWHPRSQR